MIVGKAGRPTIRTEETIEAICGMLGEGYSLVQICRAEDMPGRRTVLEWLDKDEEFRAKYVRAREAQADVMDDLILQVADACTPETAAADRIKIDAYKWRASKLAPKRYGDRVVHAGDADAPIRADVSVTFHK